MRQQLPKSILPNPLLSSTVEIRFVSDLSSEEVYDLLSSVFEKDFPEITKRGLAEEKQNRPELKYSAEYIMKGKDYQVFFDNNVIAFENIGGYHLWENYFPIVKSNLALLSEKKIIKQIERVGLRYVSFFENIENLKNILNVNLNISFENYQSYSEHFQTLLSFKERSILLQIAKNVKLSEEDIVKKGTLIDIDVSQNVNLPTTVENDLFAIIEKLHYEEKKLFFSLLKKEFLKKLTIHY